MLKLKISYMNAALRDIQIEQLLSSSSADVSVATSVDTGDQNVGGLAGRNRREPDARSLLDLGHGLENDVPPSGVAH